MYQDYNDRVSFLFVYIQEAHPDDGWQMDSNRKDDVIVNEPTTLAERRAVAGRCCTSLKLSMPSVVDTMDNQVDNTYAGWPERIFVIDSKGRIAYAGEQGPWGFKPKELERWLRRNVGRPSR